MRRPLRSWHLVLTVCLAPLASACGEDLSSGELDPIDAPFPPAAASAGKSDAAGIADASPAGRAILAFVNRAALEDLVAVDGPDLHPRAAGAIVEARQSEGSFDTLAELDAVPHVGPVALWKLHGHLERAGLVTGGAPPRIVAASEPLQVGDATYFLTHDHLLLKNYERPTATGAVITTAWMLHVQADHLAYDEGTDRLIAFGPDQLYFIRPSGIVEAVIDEGYEDIPNLRVDLLAKAPACAVFRAVASHLEGVALSHQLTGRFVSGAVLRGWAVYFRTLVRWHCA